MVSGSTHAFTLCAVYSLSAVISSVDELIEELSGVINRVETYTLCICLKITFDDCETIHKRPSLPSETWNLIADIANAWYETSSEHGWSEVVSALKCLGKSTEAYNLARRKGVN